MNGFEILFKSLGIDPEKIKLEMQAIIKALRDNLEALNTKMASIDARLERIELELKIRREQEENPGKVEPLKRIAN